ncbi:MAG: hypothetical protein U9N14_06995, partial [Pseudomonadota bacterium]|nr:hypothetical protein [Pseudomonadota bacterium]
AQLLVPEAEIEAIAAGRTKEPTLTGYNPGGSDPGEILAVLRIAPLIPVKAAVFERGGYLWAVFDEPLERVPPERLGPQGNRIERPERFLIEGGTAFRFSVPFAHAIDTFHDGLVWDIVILDKPRAKPSVFARVRESDDHTENLLHIDTGPAVPALEVTDPDVGDRLLVVPFDDPGTVFSENRRYPELELLPAVQGVVIRPIRDDLIVECGDDGIVIRAPAGLKLSYSTEDLEGMGRDLGRGSVTRAFDFDSWRRGPRSEWHNQRRLLETVLIKTDEADRVTAMLDLARFHFAHGMAQEALGILDLALENKPEIEKSPQFRALRGGALAYAHRHNETVRDLSRDLWGDHPEIALWRGYAQAENGDWRSAADSFAMAGDLIKFYPDPFRAKLGLVAAEAALIAGDTKSAKRIANQIREPGIPDDEAARAGLDWIEGGIQARKGDIDKAREAWERIAQSGDRFYRAKARLSLIDLLSDRGEINSDEAIEQLESMRFAWRNSELEFDVLNRLGTLHLAAGHARSGMTLLRQAAALIPNSPEAERIARTLTETYRKLFVEGGADELEAVEAFALYQDF